MSEDTEVGYTTENEVISRYENALTAATTYSQLLDVCEKWKGTFPDIEKPIKEMRKAGFREWRKGLEQERKGIFAGLTHAERYSAILMPELAIKATMLAEDYGVPWGAAYIRLREESRNHARKLMKGTRAI